MKLILFKEDETNFNSNGIAVLYDAIRDEIDEERNGEFELYFEYPDNGKWIDEIKEHRIVRGKPSDRDEPHNFRIYEIRRTLDTGMIIVNATTATNDLGGNLVREVGGIGTPQQHMTNALGNLVEPTDISFVSDIDTESEVHWLRRSPLNCIAGEQGSLIQIFGGEIKRTDRVIYLYSRRGRDSGMVVRQGRHIDGFSMDVNTQGLVTRILPYFTYTPEGEEDEVTITGDVVDSPLVNNYPTRNIRPIDYSGDSEVIDLATLNAAASRYFIDENPDIDKPNVTVDVDMVQLSDSPEYAKFKDLETIGLTDTIVVYVPKHKVDVTLKVTALKYSSIREKTLSLTAGSNRPTFYESVKGSYQHGIDALEKYVNSQVNGVRNTVQMTADMRNRIFRGYTEPTGDIAKENDLWYKELGSGEISVFIFNGASWDPLIDANMNEATKAALADAKKRADDARGVADANEITANSILAGLGLSPLGETHADIINGINTELWDKVNTKVDGTDETYNALIDRDDLYTRVLGSTEDGVKNSVTGIIQSSQIIQTEVKSFTGDYPNIFTNDAADSLAPGEWNYRYADTVWEINVQYKIVVSHTTGDINTLEMRSPTSYSSTYTYLYSVGPRKYYERALVFNQAIDELELIHHGNEMLGALIIESLRRNVPDSLADRVNNTSTKVTQLADSYAIGITSNDQLVTEINLSESGVIVKGQDIIWDGDVTVIGNLYVTDEMFADSMSIDKFKTGTLTATNMTVVGLNASGIVGKNADLIKASFNDITSVVNIDGSGFDISRADGSRNARLSVNGYEFWMDGTEHGKLSILAASDTVGPFVGKKSVSLAVEEDAYISLSYRENPWDTDWTRAFGIDGENGDIYMDNIHPSTSTSEGFSFRTIAGGGVKIRHKNAIRGIEFYSDNDVDITGTLSTDLIRPYHNATQGAHLSAGSVSGHYGIWIEDASETTGIFFSDDGYPYLRTLTGIYSLTTVLRNAGFPNA